MRFKVGDLVWVAHCCPRDARCREEYGMIFKVRAHTDNTFMCVHCGERKTGQFVAHPALPGDHWIPSAFLRLIDPDALVKKEDERQPTEATV